MKQRFFGKTGIAVALSALLLVGLGSCKKMLDVQSKDTVDPSQAYRNVSDADAAVLGIYGKVMNLAKQYELWNELRGDLMDVTANADQYLKQLNEHNPTADNPYVNPRPFYEVILNCNDVLKAFGVMLQQSKLKVDEYNQRYSDVSALRTWVYLQLGIQFGKIPYVTNSLAQVSDLQNPANFPQLELKPLIDTLVRTMEALPYLNNYANATLLTTIDGYPSRYFFVNKNMLLGDLYLWQGQYNKAAFAFRRVLDIQGLTGNTEAFYSQYKISSFASAAGTVSYSRAGDPSSLVYTDGWRNFFERGYDDAFSFEWIWVLPFDKSFAPTNPFVDLMSPIGGRYQVRPSQYVIDSLWGKQVQTVLTSNQPVLGMNFDARANFSYRNIGGQPVIMKYLYNYLGATNVPANVLQEGGKWFLARGAGLNLRFAEAANRDGQYKLAYAIVNRGIRDAFDSAQVSPLLPDSIGKNYKAYVQARDVTNLENTNNLPDPYKFDARQGDGPSFRASWYRFAGIRGRANLFAVKLPGANMSNYLNSLNAGNMTAIEDMIIQENALELAFEGQRWPDLLRIAIRRDDASFLADKVYSKLLKSGISAGAASQARAKLMAKDWFLPYKWQ